MLLRVADPRTRNTQQTFVQSCNAVAQHAHTTQQLAIPGSAEFVFAPPSDPASDAEAFQERAAIIAEGSGMDQAQALQEARWHVDREQCWRVFLHNAQRILAAPISRRAALLADYQAQAARRYGEATAQDMAGTMHNWIAGKGVH